MNSSPAQSAPSGLVALVIGGTGKPRPPGSSPSVPLQYSARWEHGELGTVVEGCEGEPDLTLRISSEDARLVDEGQLDPSVAFMQGKLKTEGDNALLLSVLKWTATRGFRQKLAELRAQQ